MSSKKKRNKKYKGSVQSMQPTVVRVNAIKRNPLHQWGIDHKRYSKPALIVSAIVAVFSLVIVGIASIIF